MIANLGISLGIRNLIRNMIANLGISLGIRNLIRNMIANLGISNLISDMLPLCQVPVNKGLKSD
jgi:hypothetical protein